jgi:PII-like signaling protein
MDPRAPAKRVRIYLSEGDKVGHQPAHLAIVELLRRERAHGATVLRAIEGFGTTGHVHVSHLVDVAQDLPVVVEWIDDPEQVERLMPEVRRLVGHALVTIDETEILTRP